MIYNWYGHWPADTIDTLRLRWLPLLIILPLLILIIDYAIIMFHITDTHSAITLSHYWYWLIHITPLFLRLLIAFIIDAFSLITIPFINIFILTPCSLRRLIFAMAIQLIDITTLDMPFSGCHWYCHCSPSLIFAIADSHCSCFVSFLFIRPLIRFRQLRQLATLAGAGAFATALPLIHITRPYLRHDMLSLPLAAIRCYHWLIFHNSHYAIDYCYGYCHFDSCRFFTLSFLLITPRPCH